MSFSDTRGPSGTRWLFDRWARVRIVFTGIVFFALWAAGTPIWAALIGFMLVATSIALGSHTPAATPSPVTSINQFTARDGDPMLEAVLAGLADPVIALDAKGEVVAFNGLASGVAPALRRGQSVSLGLRNPECLDAIRKATEQDAAQRVEFFVRVPVARWYEAIVMPVDGMGADQSAGLVLVTFHDLTPLRRVEEMRADFVANASHELRTPLAALSGFIETLRGPARDDADARNRFLGIMHGQATRMARLINDLLSLSRIELNEHLRPDQKVDLVSIVRQVSDSLQTLARDRGVEVLVEARVPELIVLGDRDELLRVFENLIENALKYAASGKRIDITVSKDAAAGREARVAVRDYGPGIEPKHLPRLTERFYRVDVAESRAQGGTGLGLALVKHILNRHGGQLLIESVAGQGATFTAAMPIAKATVGKNSNNISKT